MAIQAGGKKIIPYEHISKNGMVEFPPFQRININMMPFVIGDDDSIPEEYRQYSQLLARCQLDDGELGKVGYLSISESFVEKGQSQRRPGIHTERHSERTSWGGGGWGGGDDKEDDEKPSKGLFQASTVDDSCMAWNVHIPFPGKMGDCENLRGALGEGILMKRNELFWMTDSCPHESLPLKVGVKRQWFRFVTSQVDIWYKEHSTPNRLGVSPTTWKIVEGSKFGKK